MTFSLQFLPFHGSVQYKGCMQMAEISSLAVWAVVIGSVMLGFFLAWFAYPAAMNAWLAAFPRSPWAGRILAALDIALVAYLLLSEKFAWVDAHRELVFLAAPAAYLLVVFFMDELLAARALGGLFLLVPFWVLKAAFVHPAPGRLLMTVFAYIMVIKGIVLVWSPYVYRKQFERVNRNAALRNFSLLTGALLGLAMIAMGLGVY